MYQIDFEHPVHIYFMGIGGISMSGLAEILLEKGFRVSGSDSRSCALTEMLESRGINIFYGQRAQNMTDDIDCVVYTSAITPDNPEFAAAKEMRLPLLTRAELLGQIMKNYAVSIAVSGTHGKTTTTSMISEILLLAGLDPTLSIGGILKTIGGNIRIGHSRYFVTEACEYTNSFLSFFPQIGIILNIEEDHLDFFKDLADIRNSFRRFAGLLPAGGVLIINGDIERYEEIAEGLPCRVITFGSLPAFDYSASDIRFNDAGHTEFTLNRPGKSPAVIRLGVGGTHNVSNALAAIALADCLSIDFETAGRALLDFEGTDRRFEYKGSIGGVTVIDDYAHHPTEIAATLQAASHYPKKELWCVFQPHTYSRTKTFLTDFAKALCAADHIVLADIYAARETDTLGISSRDLQQEIRKLGHECEYFPTFDEIENFLLEKCTPGDLLITMGAGDVHKIGENLLGQ